MWTTFSKVKAVEAHVDGFFQGEGCANVWGLHGLEVMLGTFLEQFTRPENVVCSPEPLQHKPRFSCTLACMALKILSGWASRRCVLPSWEGRNG